MVKSLSTSELETCTAVKFIKKNEWAVDDEVCLRNGDSPAPRGKI